MKKGQAWGIDVMFAAAIFTLGIIAFYFFTINYQSADNNSAEITNSANVIASSLTSEGLPKNWNSTLVTKIGLMSSGKIDEIKLKQFYDMSLDDYDLTKQIFNTRFDYFVNFSDTMTIDGVQVDGIGKYPQDATNILRVTHYIVYKDKPVTMYIIVWES